MRALVGTLTPLLVLLAVSCGGEAQGPAGPDPTSPPEELVSLLDAGGIAGINDRLTVSQQGRVQFTSNAPSRQRTAQLSQEELQRLREALAKVDFGKLPRSTNPDAGSPDSLYHEIRYQGHSVELVYKDIPPALEPVLRQLGPLMTELSR